MLITAHFPSWLVLFPLFFPFYFRTGYLPPDTDGIWVRIGGACWAVSYVMMVVAQFTDTLGLLLVAGFVLAAGAAFVIVSFFDQPRIR